MYAAMGIAEALQYSLNVPAVAVLDHLGPGRFTSALAAAGIRLHLPRAETEPGLAVALGGALCFAAERWRADGSR